jgi:hypothetical protein
MGCSAGWQPAVSPIVNRQVSSGRAIRRLPTGDTADCQSALHRFVIEVVAVTVPWPQKRNLLSLVSATGFQHSRAPEETERGCVS